MATLAATILNRGWLARNEAALRELFPEDWRPLYDFNAVAVGERLRALGVDWQGERELTGVLATLEYIGVMQIALGQVPFSDKDIQIVRRGALDFAKLARVVAPS
jgi:hypothetical protein